MDVNSLTLNRTKRFPTTMAEGCEAHFESRYRERFATDHPDMIEYFERHLFFITMTFRPSRISLTPGLRPHPLGELNRLYFRTMRNVLGNNLNRKRQHQSLVYAFLDFAGSRHAKSFDPNNLQNIHIHAIGLTSPQHRLPFQIGMADWFTRTRLVYDANHEEISGHQHRWDDDWLKEIGKFSTIDCIEIQNFKYRNELSLYDLITYCMKGMAKLPKNVRDEFWLMCPA